MRSALRFRSDAKVRLCTRVIGLFSFNQVNSVATFLGQIFSLVHKVPGRKKKKEEHFYRFKVDILCLKPNIINNRLFILAKTRELEVSLTRSCKTDRLKDNYYKKCQVVHNRQKTRRIKTKND